MTLKTEVQEEEAMRMLLLAVPEPKEIQVEEWDMETPEEVVVQIPM
jgi:hypothetical protein